MMIREQGKQIQLIRTIYDKEKKRGVQKVAGVLDRYADAEPSAELMTSLSASEQQQLTDWLANKRIERKQHADSYNIAYAATQLRSIADGIESACNVKNNPHADRYESARDKMTDEWASACWEQISRLQKLMRRAGHPRPRAAETSATTDAPSLL